MQFKTIGAQDKDLAKVKKINDEAFPPGEHMSMEKMLTFPIPSEIMGFYDGKKLIGFSLLLHNEQTVYVFFLAIDKRCRGKGYGSRALQFILSKYPQKQIVIDFEEVVSTAENYEQRAARKRFYLKNGFYETGRFTVLSHEKFEVVCSKKTLEEESLCKMMTEIHRHAPEFEETLK